MFYQWNHIMKAAIIVDDNSLEKEIGDKSCQLIFKSLEKLNYEYELFRFPKDLDKFLSKYKEFQIAIPVIHWWFWEWWQISWMCELLNLPTLFSPSDVHWICFHKSATNAFVSQLWVNIPPSYYLTNIEEIDKIPFSWPFFVKPNKSGSSLDCGRFESIEQWSSLIEKILKYSWVCIQKAIKAREFTVSVSGDKTPKILGIMEIITEKEFFDFDAKYKRDKTKEIFPVLDKNLEDELVSNSLKIYSKLWLTDLWRVDYLYSDKLYFLEVNTIPWLTPNSFLPQCVKHYWYEDFSIFLQELIINKLNN